MFLHLSVILFTGRGVSPLDGWRPPLDRDPNPWTETPWNPFPWLTSSGDHRSERYASYWNAYLLFIKTNRCINTEVFVAVRTFNVFFLFGRDATEPRGARNKTKLTRGDAVDAQDANSPGNNIENKLLAQVPPPPANCRPSSMTGMRINVHTRQTISKQNIFIFAAHFASCSNLCFRHFIPEFPNIIFFPCLIKNILQGIMTNVSV